MSGSSVGTPDEAVATPGNESLRRALELCDLALDVMDDLQREGSIDPEFQAAVAAVQAVRTELIDVSRGGQ